MKYAVLALLLVISPVAAQEVLDRVLARVDGEAITLSDARAALALGIVDTAPGDDPNRVAMQQLIDRRLVLTEVARFAPPEPDAAAIQREITALKARVGTAAQLAALEATTGVGESQIRDIARDSLRIQAYLNQRFGPTVQPSAEEVGAYYRTHLEEFRVGDRLIPFEEAEPVARERAGAERRQALIVEWMRDLRQRADVTEIKNP